MSSYAFKIEDANSVSTTSMHDYGPPPSTTAPQVVQLWRRIMGTRDQHDEAAQRISKLEQDNVGLRKKVEQLTRREAYARYLANHDGLTGLCNRSLLLDRFVHAAAHAQRCGHSMALLLFDLDGFKAVNDQFGHLAADRLLQHIAKRLETLARAGDTVCRYGGDEFVVLLPGIDSAAVAQSMALRIQQDIADCLRIDDIGMEITASCGIALYPDDGSNWSTLMEAADAAMYHSKPAGPGLSVDGDTKQHMRWRRRHDSQSPLCLPDVDTATMLAVCSADGMILQHDHASAAGD